MKGHLNNLLSLLRGEKLGKLSRKDASVLLAKLTRHRLLSQIDSSMLQDVSEEDRINWKKAIQSNILHTLQLSANLEEIVHFLQSRGFPFVVFKGPQLSMQLFGDVGKRHYRDLDILVKPFDIHEIIAALKDEGFVLKHPDAIQSMEQWDYYFRYKKDVDLAHPRKNVALELHLSLFRSELVNSASDERTFNAAVPFKMGNSSMLIPEKHHYFLYLLYHGGQHMYFRLFWLLDVSRALKDWELDHSRVLSDARQMGMERLLLLGMEMCREVFKQEIPKVYVDAMAKKRRSILRLKKLSLCRILGPEEETTRIKLARYIFIISLRPGLNYKVRILKNIIPRRKIKKQLGGI